MSIRNTLTGLFIVLSFLSKATCTFVPSVVSTTLNTCSDLCNGTATIMIFGTTGPYVITGAGAPVTTTGAPVMVMGLCGGVTTLLVTDAGGCSTPVVVTLVGPAPLTLSASVTPATSGCTGAITASSGGGTFPHVYSLDGGPFQTSPVFTNVCVGTHTLCVIDVNGCTHCISATVTASCSMVSTVGGITNVTCYGSCDGSAVVASTLGTAPYTATLSPGGATYTYTGSTGMTGLCAGVYTVNVSDAVGCTNTYTFTITEPPALTLSVSTTNESTPGACDGGATLTASGGTPAYTYTMDDGSGPVGCPGSVTGLCAGTYTFCAIDANLCQTCTTVVINTSSCSGMVSTVFPTTPIGCYGSCDGVITLASTGGTPPYTVINPTGGGTTTYSSSTTFSGMCAGTYTFYITDAAGCTNLQVLTLTQPAQIIVSTSTTSESSPGADDGSITITASGGSGAFVYSIDGGASWFGYHVFVGLTSGTYNVCVEDVNSCIQCTTATITSASCSGMVSTVYPTSNVTCYGSCDGVITLASTGGTAPYSVTTPWGPIVTYTSSTTFTGICAGTYTFYITDAAGCTNVETATLTQPTQIIVTASVTNESAPGACDGSINATASGGISPYVYSIDGGVTWGGSHIFTGLCAGTYTVCAEDINGCVSCTTYVVSTAGCTLTSPFINTFSPTCHGGCDGFVVIGISGGTAPYTTTVGSSSYTSSGPVTVPGLCAGTHTAVVADAGGCAITVTFVITDPSAIVTTISVASNPSSASACDGVINGAVTGGTGSYSYNWVSCPGMSPAGITSAPPASGFCAGSYAFIVTDANGCTDTSTCVTLSGPTGLTEIHSETIALYPNPTTGVLNIRTGSTGPLRLVFTDLLGKRLADLPLNGESNIDLHAQGMDTGIYFVSVTSGEKIVYTRKIVLTR